jgi:phenylalanyl-tRNA synthetase beta chain
VDVEREVDLIEEVARVYGYDRIPENTRAAIEAVQPYPRLGATDGLRRHLASAGFQEAITNSMHDEWRARLAGPAPVRLLNPLSQDMAFLRTSLVPGLLDVVLRNLSFGNTTLRLFEVGHVFSGDPGPYRTTVVEGYFESEVLAIVLTGLRAPPGWDRAGEGVDFYDIRGVLEGLLGQFSLDKWRLISYSTSDGLTDNPLLIEIEGVQAGYLGRVRDSVLERIGVRQPVYVAEIAAKSLLAGGKKAFEPLPKFPRVRRDVALVVRDEVTAAELEAAVREGAGDLLQSVEVFDVFVDPSLGAGKKSLAFALELMSRERTLTDQEIDQVVRAAVREAGQRCGATLRGATGGG